MFRNLKLHLILRTLSSSLLLCCSRLRLPKDKHLLLRTPRAIIILRNLLGNGGIVWLHHSHFSVVEHLQDGKRFSVNNLVRIDNLVKRIAELSL